MTQGHHETSGAPDARKEGDEATDHRHKDGKLQQRRGTLGHRTIDGRVEIVSGVPEGAQLVTSPTTGLTIGRRVVIAPSEKPAGEKKK